MDVHEAHVAAIRANNSLLKGTYEDGYKAGREAGLRDAADIANQHGSVESIAQKIESAILAAIGEGK